MNSFIILISLELLIFILLLYGVIYLISGGQKWSIAYKNSIDCSHTRGFSQRAHCKGRLK